MNTYEFYYAIENGFVDRVFIDAPNRFCAWEQFIEFMKNFDDLVVTVDCTLVRGESRDE